MGLLLLMLLFVVLILLAVALLAGFLTVLVLCDCLTPPDARYARGLEAPVTLSYELVGEVLRLTSPEPFRHSVLPFPVELSGAWRREGKW